MITKTLNQSTQKVGQDYSGIKFVQVTSRKAFAALESEWDAFLLNTQVPSPFLSWDYLDVWWAVYGDKQYDVKLYIARDGDGKLVAAAPLMISHKGAFAGARGKFRHLAFMGGVGDLLGESLELPALPGYEKSTGEATAKLIAESFRGLWDVLYLYLVPEQSLSVQAMMTELAEEGVQVKMTHSLPSPVVSITSSWEDYLKTRSSKFNRAIRYTHSLAIRRFGLKNLIVGEDMPMDDAYDHMVRLSSKRWGGDAQAFHTPEVVEFHRQLIPRFHQKGQLSFDLIELDSKIAGAAYDFIFGGKMWGYQAPWDTRFHKARVGYLLNVGSIQKAFNLGLRELDALPGESGLKDDWTDSAHTLNIYEVACPRSMGGTLYKIARKIDCILKQKSNSTPKS